MGANLKEALDLRAMELSNLHLHKPEREGLLKFCVLDYSPASPLSSLALSEVLAPVNLSGRASLTIFSK